MDNHDARLDRIRRALKVIYVTLTGMLAELPLSIELPPLGEEADEHRVALDALDRARGLLKDQPLRRVHRDLLLQVIVEWATLYELAATLESLGTTELRLDSAEMTAARVTIYLDKIREVTGES